MTSYLFLFTIGPVQSFILQARTTGDLFAGSRILSDLIGAGLEALQEKVEKVDFIYPVKDVESRPNRFLVKIQAQSAADLSAIGQTVEQAVRADWQKKAETALGNTQKPKGWQEQIETLIEIYWVFMEAGADYATAQRDIEGELAAVKNNRYFQPLPQSHRKCAVCGERTALLYRKGGQAHALSPHAVTGRKYILQTGEALCSVCYTKRFFAYNNDEQESYPATAAVALMHTKKYLADAKPELLQSYAELFGKTIGNLDAQLFYADNLTENYFKKQDLSEFIAKLPEIKQKHKELSKEIQEAKFRFGKYYAVIVFDGDGMGDLIAGSKLKPGKKLEDFHPSFSGLLGEFAKKAQQYLKEPLGQAVYAGGDDFLGFVSLDSLFRVMQHLRAMFDNIVSLPLEKEFIQGKVSFSAGVAIAHYKMPMSEAMFWGRKMEADAKHADSELGKQAKDAPGFLPKNAWSVAVLKHSGEIHKTRFKWGKTDLEFSGDRKAARNGIQGLDRQETLSALELWELVTVLLSENWVSQTFINNLSVEFSRLEDKPENYPLFGAELKRLLGKSQLALRAMDKNKRNDFIEYMFEQTQRVLQESKSIQNFLYMLQISEFIAREVNHVQ